MADDFRSLGLTSKKREADEPCRGIRTQVVKEVEGLSFEALLGLRVPGDFDGILDL